MGVLVRWFLYETRLGLFLLAVLERRVGLAVVNADWLGRQPSCWPVSAEEAE